MNGRYEFAGIVIEIESIYRMVHEMCHAYSCIREADLSVRTDETDILRERQRSEEEDIREGIPIRSFSDEYLETLAVYRKIAEELPRFEALLVHGSAIAVNGEGFLFLARSGVGKSTHAKLWMDHFQDCAQMINDDKPILRFYEGGVYVCGTPWDGKHHRSSNARVPLRVICFLERAVSEEGTTVEPVGFREAYPKLMTQVYRPEAMDALFQTIRLMDRLEQRTAIFTLRCTMESEAAKNAYNGIVEHLQGKERES